MVGESAAGVPAGTSTPKGYSRARFAVHRRGHGGAGDPEAVMLEDAPGSDRITGRLQHDPREPLFLDYPFSFGSRGLPTTTTHDDHLRDLITQVLFTCPGERVNLPEFGACIQRLVFEPASAP